MNLILPPAMLQNLRQQYIAAFEEFRRVTMGAGKQASELWDKLIAAEITSAFGPDFPVLEEAVGARVAQGTPPDQVLKIKDELDKARANGVKLTRITFDPMSKTYSFHVTREQRLTDPVA